MPVAHDIAALEPPNTAVLAIQPLLYGVSLVFLTRTGKGMTVLSWSLVGIMLQAKKDTII